jgi:serine/threonine-protein kinase
VERIGRYVVRERVGEGGMAEVFVADLSGAAGFSKRLAIKRVRGAYAFDPQVSRAFVEEAQLAQRLQHGNIVQVYDLGLDGKSPYLVMEYVDGLSLEDLLLGARVTERALDVGDALHVIEQVSDALDHAHRLADDDGNPIGVVHRDVNPRNILVSADGVIKLTDFGIAKALDQPSRTLPGRIKGTLGYLSPEQAAGASIDARSDQFATGVVLYQLLAGRNPLAEVDGLLEYREVCSRGLPPLAGERVDAELAAVGARATAVDPDERFASMAELRQVLEAWRVSRGIRTSADGLRDAVRRYSGRGSVRSRARLDDAVLAQLAGEDEDGTRHLPAAPPSPRRRWRLAIAAVVLLGIGAVALGVFAGGDRGGDAVAARTPDAATEAEAGAETEAETGTEAGAETGTATETATEAETEAQTETEAETRAETETEAETGAETETETGTEAEAETGTEIETGTETETGTGTGTETETGTETAPATETATETAKRSRGSGTLKVNVLPWAWVSIDGKRAGKTPLRRSLAAGPHVVELFNPQTGQRIRRRVEIADRRTVVIKRW